jgi:hypothetical protein
MRAAFLFPLLLLISASLCGQQSIRFPNEGDGSRYPDAKYAYLRGFYAEVSDTGLVCVFSNQGTVTAVADQRGRYFCKPKATGDFYLNAVYQNNKNGKDTLSAGIQVIPFPELKLSLSLTDLDSTVIIHTQVIDASGRDVTDQYAFGGVLGLFIENEWSRLALIHIKTIDLAEEIAEFDYLSSNMKKIEKISIETFTLYNIETDLPVGILKAESALSH